MLRTIGTLLASIIAPKIIDTITGVVGDAYDSVFNDDDEPVVRGPKPYDSTRFTVKEKEFIKDYHENTVGTYEEHAIHLNQHFKRDKSSSSYARIWNKK